MTTANTRVDALPGPKLLSHITDQLHGHHLDIWLKHGVLGPTPNPLSHNLHLNKVLKRCTHTCKDEKHFLLKNTPRCVQHHPETVNKKLLCCCLPVSDNWGYKPGINTKAVQGSLSAGIAASKAQELEQHCLAHRSPDQAHPGSCHPQNPPIVSSRHMSANTV